MSLKELFGLSLLVLHIMIRDGGGKSDGFRLKIFIFHLLSKFLEESLEKLLLVVHDLDNWRGDLLISENKILLGSVGSHLCLSEGHFSEKSIILIKTSYHFVFVHLDLIIMLIVPRSNQITKCLSINFSVSKFSSSSLTHCVGETLDVETTLRSGSKASV